MRIPIKVPVFSCKDCLDRAPGCHIVCKRYQSEKAEYERDKFIANSIDQELDCYVSESINKNMDLAAKKPKYCAGRFTGLNFYK